MKIQRNVMLLAAGMMLGTMVFAQKASVETASIALRTYKKDTEKKDVRIHNLKEAKKHVDMAVDNPTTSNDPKMWLMRAQTYLAIHRDKLGPEGGPVIQDDEAIATASEAIVNLYKSDTKKKYSEKREAYETFVGIAVSAQNIAIVAYNDKNYDRAIQYYQIPRDLIPYDDQSLIKRQNITSDGLLNSIAYAEFQAKKYDDAKKHYNELIDKSYNDPLIYMDLYTIYLTIDKDTAKAIETIDKGRMMFEEDRTLKYEQIYIYSAANREDELLNILSENIEMDPYNSSNYLMRGKLYRNLSDRETEKGDEKSKENASAFADKSIADLEKAVELDDQNMDAHQELGEMYYLKGAAVLEEANKLGFDETAKFEELNAEAKDYFMKSIPSWEALYNYSTDEKQSGKAAQFLKQMYLKTEQMDKYKELKAEMGQ